MARHSKRSAMTTTTSGLRFSKMVANSMTASPALLAMVTGVSPSRRKWTTRSSLTGRSPRLPRMLPYFCSTAPPPATTLSSRPGCSSMAAITDFILA